MPALYDRIGSTYAKTRLADPGITQNLAREIRLTSSEEKAGKGVRSFVMMQEKKQEKGSGLSL